MIILAARPGMGKTALALNMAAYAATTTKKAIAIFNLEMSAEMLINRMISSIFIIRTSYYFSCCLN